MVDFRITSKKLLEYIHKNPGLSNRMLNERFHQNVGFLLRKLLQQKKIFRIEGIDRGTMYKAYLYFPVKK